MKPGALAIDHDVRRSTSQAILRFVAVQFAALLLGLGLQCVLSRRLSEIDYVRFVTCLSLTSALSVMAGGAAPKAVARLVALDPGWTANGLKILGRFHLSCCGLLALVLMPVGPLIGQFYADNAITLTLWLLAVEFFLRAGIAEPVWQLLNGLGEHRSQASLMGIHSLIRACATSAIVVVDPTVRGAACGLLLTAAVSALLAVRTSRELTAASFSSGDHGPGEVMAEVRRWWAYGAFVDGSLFFLPPAILWITMAHSSRHSELAVLTASYVLGQAVVPMLQAINRGFVRLTVVHDEQHSSNQARAVLASVLGGLMPITGLVLLSAFTGGARLLSVLFGARYTAVWWLPGMVILGMVALSLAHLFSEALGNCGELRRRFHSVLLAGAGGLAATVYFSRIGGPAGGAVSIGLTGLLMLVSLGSALQARIGQIWPWRGMRDVAFSSCLALGSWRLLYGSQTLRGLAESQQMVLLFVIPLVYLAGLLLTKEPGTRQLLRTVASRLKAVRPSATNVLLPPEGKATAETG